MFEILDFVAFYILVPAIVLIVIGFNFFLIIGVPSTKNRVRGIVAVFSGLLVTAIIILFDFLSEGLIENQITIFTVGHAWLTFFLMMVIGFLWVYFVNFLVKRSKVSIAHFFTVASVLTLLYFFITLSEIRQIVAVSTVGFSLGWLTFFVVKRWLYTQFSFDMIQVAQLENPVAGIISAESLEKEMNKLKAFERILADLTLKLFRISISHPRLLSKRFGSLFLVQMYLEPTSKVKEKIKEIFGEDYSEHDFETAIRYGQVVKIKLYSPDISFPEPIKKKLDMPHRSMVFIGKPLDACQPGEHKVSVSIIDSQTDIEFQSETFSVKVVDFAFDHVSRPLLSRLSAVVLGVGSFAMFILTFLEQVDKTIGLTSGTAAGVLAAVAYANFYNLYQRTRPNTP